MKKAACVLILFTFCLHSTSFSQTNDEAFRKKYINSLDSIIRIHRASSLKIRPGLHDRLNNTLLPTFNPGLIKHTIPKYVNKQSPLKSRYLPGERALGNIACNDTSFVRLFNAVGSTFYMTTIVPASDGGILVPGILYDTSKPNFTYKTSAFLLKADADGNPVWMKKFDNTSPGLYSSFFMYNAFELSNKDILCVASIDTTQFGSLKQIIVMKLDQNGNLIWQNGLQNTIDNTHPIVPINIRSVAEGINGDIILGGYTDSYTSDGEKETIIRLNSSGGIVWDANFGNTGSYRFGAEGYGIFMQNGNLTATGISYGSNNPVTTPALTVLTLDYNTGNLLDKHFFKPDYPGINTQVSKAFTYFNNASARLSNGDFVFYGKLFSDYNKNTPVIDHFGVVEFNPSFNFASAYTINSSQPTTFGNDLLFIDKTGKGVLDLFETLGPSGGKVDFASYENGQFLSQRKYNYVADNIGDNGFAFSNDSGFIYAQSYDATSTKNAVEFRKMHNSDTSSVCLGTDTSFLKILPLQIIEDPLYPYLDTNISNKVLAVHYNITESDTVQVLTTDPCKQVNNCDTIKIHGNSVICGSQPSILFTAYKNPECGSIVQWNIDSSAIDSLEIQTDTSALVYFRNINWRGNIYASLPATACKLRLTDSLSVSIIRQQNAINLGPDIILCRGNTIMLHAGSTFSRYKWQDGSTDSIFNVITPGKYYVSASDVCGNNFSDTILVTGANFPFSIGNDTMRCNKDSIRLTATGGFSNYQWRPVYNISADTGRTVAVLPLVDTFYIATAEKRPGCFVSDTINISVLTSPAIHLGNDTSFCVGQSLALNAGIGFSSYAWSTGATSQQITVNQQGTYSIKATAPNNCISYDTLQIINIVPLPVFTLGNDTTLCEGIFYSYNFNLSNAAYLWGDGSMGNQYTISQPGTYSLAVTQEGCTAKDTVIINYKNNPQVYLGSDATVCAGNTVLLNATYNNATYLWQDGSTQPDFLVNSAGLYYVTLNLAGCTAKDTIQITYLDKPFFTLGRDTVLCQGTTITLQPHLTVPAAYLWQDGSTLSSFTIKDTGTYKLTVTNTCGSSTDDITITPGPCNIMLPNAFTPNGDGVNDIFRVKYPYLVKSFLFKIFNRFGQIIFETANMNKGWDGFYKDLPQPIGTYVWTIQLVDTKNVAQSYKGIVTLIR